MDYKQLFLRFIRELNDDELARIGASEVDICWDGGEFLLWAHDSRCPYFIVFNSEADSPFDAKMFLQDFAEVVDDHFLMLEA